MPLSLFLSNSFLSFSRAFDRVTREQARAHTLLKPGKMPLLQRLRRRRLSVFFLSLFLWVLLLNTFVRFRDVYSLQNSWALPRLSVAVAAVASSSCCCYSCSFCWWSLFSFSFLIFYHYFSTIRSMFNFISTVFFCALFNCDSVLCQIVL